MLRLITFGGLSLVDDGAPVTGAASQRSRLALLAVLAASGQAGVSRDKLLACLWPESEAERARHALKQAVYALRRDLGNENAIAGTATLTLDPTIVTSDIREFEDALVRSDDAAAVAVYAGAFLDGVFVRGAAEFDQWAATERTRLERAFLDAVERLARGAESRGDATGAAQWWRRAAAVEPLSGRYALSLMRALAESGDVSSAIQHARVHDAVVRAELDSSADDAVTAFAEQLRSGDWTPPVRVAREEPQPSIAAPPDTSVTPAADALAPSAPVITAPPTLQKEPRRRRSKLVLAAVAFVVLIAVAVAGALTRDRMMTPATAPSNRRIVVAQFANRTGDPRMTAAGYLAAEFIGKMLIESNFEVVDPSTSASALQSILRRGQLSTANDSAAALATETGASTVIAGSFYRQGDSLLFQATVRDPAKRLILHVIGPVSGKLSEPEAIVSALARKISVALAASADSTPGASTAALITPPTIEAFVHSARGWEMFFERPADTAAAFKELALAITIDTAYTTPRLMRAYILDVKERWADLASEVKQLDSRRAHMGRVELAALALYDADLRGDLVGRLRASRDLLRLSPGSIDMSLLVAVSASYLHRPTEVLDVLNKSNPDRGINVLTPMYWAWRAEAEHSLARFDEELVSSAEMLRRFPGQSYGAQARVRALSAKGDTAKLYAYLATLGYGATRLTSSARTMGLLAARELRAHGHAAEATPIFARIAGFSPPAAASREERAEHAIALYETGDFGKARAAYSSLLASDADGLDALGRLGSIALRTGDSAAFRQVEARIASWNSPYALGRPTLWRAHYAALSHHGGEAIALLHEAMSKGYRAMDLDIITLHEEPDFMSVWHEPAFVELLNRRSDPVVSP